MKTETIINNKRTFDALAQTIPGQTAVEFWFARDLQEPLGYVRWESFCEVIKRAIDSCKTTGYNPSDHFRDVTKMVPLGSGSQREVSDFMCTRYACFLIAQNGDPRKEPIAFAQSYFALQTRKQEIIEERMLHVSRLAARNKLKESEKVLSELVYQRGVDDAGFGRIRSRGDASLFGGLTTRQLKKRFGIVQSRPLADFLPTLTIAAKNLATEMTTHNIQQTEIAGEAAISAEHIQNNKSVRTMLARRGIKPEELPAEPDIKKIERRVRAEEIEVGKRSGKLPDP
jgi:DNA-damage-inducible protein D